MSILYGLGSGFRVLTKLLLHMQSFEFVCVRARYLYRVQGQYSDLLFYNFAIRLRPTGVPLGYSLSLAGIRKACESDGDVSRHVHDR
jgi:hypothetical protein